MKQSFILILLLSSFLTSCNRPEGKDPGKADPANYTQADSAARTAQPGVRSVPMGSEKSSSESAAPGEVKLIPTPSIVMPGANGPSMAKTQPPIGSVPVLRPEQLVAFHPKLPDYYMVRPQIHDDGREAQSIIFFKNKKDTTKTIRSIVMDANERAASQLIWEMSQMQAKKEETKVIAGESITSHYLDLNGMHAIKAYIASRQVATLYVLVGDHRAISLRESHAVSADHLIEVAKTIDFQKLEALQRN